MIKEPKKLSVMAEEELTNIAFVKGQGYLEAMYEEMAVWKSPQTLTLSEIMIIDKFVSQHYQIDKKDYEERLKINLEFAMPYKAAVNMAKRFSRRIFAPNFEILDNEENTETLAPAEEAGEI